MTSRLFIATAFAAVVAASVEAAPAAAKGPVATVEKAGAERITVSLDLPAGAYQRTLARNLELSGWFQVGRDGSIKVSGTPGVSVVAVGRGMQVTATTPFSDDKSARMAARRFSDAIVKSFSDGGVGYATTRIAFVNRKGAATAELYTCYPDGQDIRQLTSDKCAAVGPRWAPNNRDIYYTGFLQKFGNVYRLDSDTGRRNALAPFKGTATGGAISPDGTKCAIVLSYQGNPELYVLDLSTKRVERLTTTKAAAEASPCWSPDGRRIAYVSDETRHPQVYVIDVATRKKSRFTSKGSENTNPDWSLDGKLCWASKRAGQTVIVVAPASGGEAAAREVTSPGSWEHPSWAADSRHIVASRDSALFIVDSDPDGDKPVRVFHNQGNWMNPAFSR